MMHAVIVYESMFGNTRDIALAIAEGLSAFMNVRSFEVSSAPHTFDDPDLLVVGGPTHAFSMSRSSTRQSAEDETEDELVSKIGIREWIEGLGDARGQAIATFDTKVPKPKLPGSAAASAARKLKKRHGRLVTDPRTFWVDGMTGPLVDGEIDRAHAWGEDLARTVVGVDERKRA